MEKKGEKPMGKIILVTGMLGNNSRGVPSFILNTAYMNAIVAAGGVPVMMGSTKLAAEYAEMADGLLITGGESIPPGLAIPSITWLMEMPMWPTTSRPDAM